MPPPNLPPLTPGSDLPSRNSVALGKLAEIHSGYSSRTPRHQSETGNSALIQAKDVVAQTLNTPETLARMHLPWMPVHHFVQAGDLVLCPAGGSHQTRVLNTVAPRTLCLDPVTHIRIRDTGCVLPDYLAWYLNCREALAALQGDGGGKVRLAALKALPVPVPPLARQQRIIEAEELNARITALERLLMEKRMAYGNESRLQMALEPW